MLSESQLLGRFFLDHEERVISLFSADAAEGSGQPAGVGWFIRGAELPERFQLLLLLRVHEGSRCARRAEKTKAQKPVKNVR